MHEGVCESSSGHDFPRTLFAGENAFGSRGGGTVHFYIRARTYTNIYIYTAPIVFDRRRRRRLRSHAKTTPSTSHIILTTYYTRIYRCGGLIRVYDMILYILLY